MKKTTLLILVASTALFAFNAEVKKESVVLTVNDEEVKHKAGDTFELKEGDLVCFMSGDGRLVIKGEKYSKQLSKRSKSCKQLPVKDSKKKDYLAKASSAVTAVFGKAKETTVAGVSSRSTVTTETITEPLVLTEENKYLVIENAQWGPLPVSIKIFNKEGNVTAEDSNEEDTLTSFIFPKSALEDGYRVEITNAFDELHMKSVVKFERAESK